MPLAVHYAPRGRRTWPTSAKALMLIVFAVFALLAMRFTAESLAAAGLPSWRPPTNMHLVSEMWMGEYAIRPPAGAIMQKLRVSPPQSGFTRMWSWTGPRREDGSIAGMVVKLASFQRGSVTLDKAVREELV